MYGLSKCFQPEVECSSGRLQNFPVLAGFHATSSREERTFHVNVCKNKQHAKYKHVYIKILYESLVQLLKDASYLLLEFFTHVSDLYSVTIYFYDAYL